MQKLLFACVFVAGLVLTAGQAMLSAAATEETAALLEKIQQQYEKMTSLRADFSQVLTNVSSKESQRRGGRVAIKKPHAIRWETLEPERELLVAGKDVVWDYFEEEKTAYKYHAAEVLDSKTMLRFLAGKARLDADFEVAPAGTDQGLTRLDLTPREPEPGLVAASVWVNAEGIIQRISMVDFYGNENVVAFANLMLNPPLEDSLFVFTPPKGVEVFDNTVDSSILKDGKPGKK